MPRFESNAQADAYYAALRRRDRAQSAIDRCDDDGKHHGSWDAELAAAEAEMRANGG